ncbi:response regulator transcription factor [Gleimia sp. 6138-11-ORH1]|uniref:response regulator transcription factor n=1 Tax=Gleimia sp. 6138-11-ORH1 TaxID=2973937 RepID=UPI00216A3119|nr:response regulator transcription factor [Gleimia sp. 6138-11-ORH1]MCS4484181.1 response regulator transcription factor [Gleimia sp. 6138-11-ORH1]
MIKVILVDDQAMVREALAALLELSGSVKVIAQAKNGVEALEIIGKLAPSEAEVLLTDIEMPQMDGLTLAENVRRSYPHLKVCIVTTFGRAGYVQRALSAGAKGFLVKDAPSKDLVSALEQIQKGIRVVDPALALDALSLPASPLTEREKDILLAFEKLGTVSEVAAELFLSAGTVRNHVSNIIAKTHAKNRAEATRIARENGWL